MEERVVEVSEGELLLEKVGWVLEEEGRREPGLRVFKDR